MNIPLNASLEEVLEYHTPRELSEVIESKVKVLYTKIEELEKEVEKEYDDYSLLEEMDSNKESLLDVILDLIKEKGTKKELVDAITLAFEDSMVEM